MRLYVYLGCTSKQLVGLILIICINIILWVVTYWMQSMEVDPYYNFDELKMRAHELELSNQQIDFHSFDPNTSSLKELMNTGLSSKISNRIISYRSKVSKFDSLEDLYNIYGIDSNWVLRVKDSIVIKKKIELTVEPEFVKPVFFNPNNVDEIVLKAMNLDDFVIKNWLTYIERGGEFKKCSDINKVYGLSNDDINILLPYCSIEEPKVEKAKIEEITLIDLNAADSAQLISLKGIGPVYADRIIKYKSNLGGFYKTEQLLEVYGFDSSRLKGIENRIYVDTNQIALLFINEVSFKELLKHPYLNYDQVKSIVNYIEAIGPITNSDELIQLESFNEVDIQKLKPYVRYSNK